MHRLKTILWGAAAFVLAGTLFAWAQLPSPRFQALTVLGLTSTGASTTAGAGLNVPPGVAPTSPNNGDVWTTGAGVFARAAGVTIGPFSSVNTPCGTCATTTNGGPLSAAAPLAITPGGAFSLGVQPFTAGINFDNTTTVHVDNYSVFEPWIWTNSGTISSVTYHTGGSSTPSFTFSLQINGTPITGCTGLVANSATDTTTTCTGVNTISSGQKLAIVISAIVGSPFSAWIQINGFKPAS